MVRFSRDQRLCSADQRRVRCWCWWQIRVVPAWGRKTVAAARRLAEGDQEYLDITATELLPVPKRSRGNVITAVPTVFGSDQPMTAARAETDHPPRHPYVVVHVAVSLDGHTTGFNVDLARFYSLLSTWQEDITLTGADTILAQERELAAAPRPGPAEKAALLVVVDSRRRVREWEALRDCGYWSGVLPLRASSRPPAGKPPIPELVVGSDRVDLRQALTQLASRTGAKVVRVDSGGQLTRVLLDLHLVDELSLLVHPCLTDAGSHYWYRGDRSPTLTLTLLAVETFDPGLVWLRYRVE
jgi:2,5-diamino-6-(ribosylamino)-4(3H)-pyrimidinone 5'-phosphate reductase